MGGALWKEEEERYFWLHIIPKSIAQPGYDKDKNKGKPWDALAPEMQRAMERQFDPESPPRRYTGQSLMEHWYKNTKEKRFSAHAEEYVNEYLRELERHGGKIERKRKRLGDDYPVDGNDGDAESTASIPPRRRKNKSHFPTPRTSAHRRTSTLSPSQPSSVTSWSPRPSAAHISSSRPNPNHRLPSISNLLNDVSDVSNWPSISPHQGFSTHHRDSRAQSTYLPNPAYEGHKFDDRGYPGASRDETRIYNSDREKWSRQPAAYHDPGRHDTGMPPQTFITRSEVTDIIRTEVARQISRLSREQHVYDRVETSHPPSNGNDNGKGPLLRHWNTTSLPVPLPAPLPAPRPEVHNENENPDPVAPRRHYLPSLYRSDLWRTALPGGRVQFPESNVRGATEAGNPRAGGMKENEKASPAVSWLGKCGGYGGGNGKLEAEGRERLREAIEEEMEFRVREMQEDEDEESPESGAQPRGDADCSVVEVLDDEGYGDETDYEDAAEDEEMVVVERV